MSFATGRKKLATLLLLGVPHMSVSKHQGRKGISYTKRHVLFDLGANWGDTTDVYASLADTAEKNASNWEVYSFEAYPPISTYLHSLFKFRNGVLRRRPPLCVPPVGSSIDLMPFARMVGCPVWKGNSVDQKGYHAQNECMTQLFKEANHRLPVDESLLSEQHVVHQLSAAHAGNIMRNKYNLISAAVGAKAGTLQFNGSWTLIKGSFDRANMAKIGFLTDVKSRHAVHVQVIDFPAFLNQYFTEDDYVVIKMDIEGAEHAILSQMLTANMTALIDVLGIECHPWSGDCQDLRQRLRKAGVRTLEESVHVSQHTYQPNVRWDAILAQFRQDIQSDACAFLNVSLLPDD